MALTLDDDRRLTDAEAVKYLARLDKLGIIELKPMNRYRTRSWRSG